MRITDFKFDNILLSSFGFMVCDFDNKGIQTISNGSEIEFNAVPLNQGKRHILTSIKYEKCIQTEIDICPLPNCTTGKFNAVSLTQERQIMRWLNRKQFCKFEPNISGYEGIYFNGSFNVEKVVFKGEIIGFHLTLTTDKPFATKDFTMTTNAKQNAYFSIHDLSDEIGTEYLKTKITLANTVASNTEVILTHRFDNKTIQTVIKNCYPNEVITLQYPMISTNRPSHQISQDFNYQFVTISNNYLNSSNMYSLNVDGTLEFTYSPIVKIGI